MILPLNPNRRLATLAIVAFAPLAYLGAIYLENRLPQRSTITSVTREQAIQISRQFAGTRHINTSGWGSGIGTRKNKQLSLVLRQAHPPLLDRLAAGSEIRAMLQSPEGDRWLRTTLTPDGRVIGFQENAPRQQPPETGEPAARELTRSFLLATFGPDAGFDLHYEKVTVEGKQAQNRTFLWSARVPGLPEARADFHVQIVGDRVIAEDTSITFDGALLDRLRPYRNWIRGLGIAGAIYLFLIGVYAIVRYGRRAMEKEVSHRRTVLVMVAFLAMTVLVIIDPGSVAAQSDGNPQVGKLLTAQQVGFMILMSFIGIFLGIAYGAGEGALRESYPDKLTSLDALLSGKLFSANVARSILAGGAIAGWLLLMQNAVLLVGHGLRLGSDHDILSSAFMRAPLAFLVWDRAWDGLLLTTFCLLLPLALLRPRIRREWIFWAVLPVFGVLSTAVVAAEESSSQNFLVLVIGLLAATWIPFFYSDLLAVTAALFGVRFVGALIQRSVVSPAWRSIAVDVAVAAAAFLLAEVWFAWRGRIYREHEVRPRYARYVAEHLAMQAEISAARQAQLRLLPDAPPPITGLSIAASCVASREVGGDFYDFYALDDHRLGVFVAEGGDRHLGSAMTIALAKGYLLYAARLEIGPAEVLRRLRDVLGDIFRDGSAGVSMLYAVIDTSAKTVRFARVGRGPAVAINGNEPAELAAGEEGIRHGAANLAPNDAVVFYTQGLAAQIANLQRQSPNRFLAKTIKDIRSGSAADLHTAILHAAIKRRKELPPADVTAVVVRLARGELAKEGVA